MKVNLINAADIQALLDMPKAIHAMQKAYSQPQDWNTSERLFLPIPTQEALSITMAGYSANKRILGAKLANLFPQNSQRQIDSIHGVIILFDSQTGMLKAILDAATITAYKTAALSALATVKMAANTQTLAVIGSGAQAESHCKAILSSCNIRQIKIYSRTPEKAKKIIQQLHATTSVKITHCSSLQEAVSDVDIICTTTSHASTIPLLPADYCSSPQHINAIGGSTLQACELDPKIYAKATVVVDHQSSILKEAYDIRSAIDNHYLERKSIIEIGQLYSPTKVTIPKNTLTVYRSVGNVSQDLILADFIYQLAISSGQSS